MQCSFEDLPLELWSHVFQYLHFYQAASLILSSKQCSTVFFEHIEDLRDTHDTVSNPLHSPHNKTRLNEPLFLQDLLSKFCNLRELSLPYDYAQPLNCGLPRTLTYLQCRLEVVDAHSLQQYPPRYLHSLVLHVIDITDSLKYLPASLRRLAFDFTHASLTNYKSIDYTMSEVANNKNLANLFSFSLISDLPCYIHNILALPFCIQHLNITAPLIGDVVGNQSFSHLQHLSIKFTDMIILDSLLSIHITRLVLTRTANNPGSLSELMPLDLRVPNLEALTLDGVSLRGCERELGHFLKLTSLSILTSHEILADQLLAELANGHPNLRELRLIKSRVSNHGVSYLSRLSKLETLSLAFNTTVNDSGVANIPSSVTDLDLSGLHSVSSQGWAFVLKSCRQLRVLTVADTLINEFAAKYIPKSVTKLDMSQTRLPPSSLASLAAAPTLRTFILDGAAYLATPLSHPRNAEAFLKRFPQLERVSLKRQPAALCLAFRQAQSGLIVDDKELVKVPYFDI